MAGLSVLTYGQGIDLSTEVKKNTAEIDKIISLGELDNAEEKLVKLLELNPKELEYRVRYGSVLIQKENSEGIVHLENVIATNPDHLFANKVAGRFYMMEGVRMNSRLERTEASKDEKASEFKKARDAALVKMTAHYKQVIRLEPKDELTLKALMNVYGLLEDEDNFNRIVQQMEALKSHQ